MSLIDHLVPALAPAYGASDPLASLPLGVWLKAPFIPFKMDEKGRATTQKLVVYDQFSKPDFRASRPDDFRYRVLEKDGRRVVEVAEVQHYRRIEKPTLEVGYNTSYNRNLDHHHMLPPIQHKLLAATASVDPQRWREEKKYSKSRDPLGDALTRVFFIYPAFGLLGLYGLYRLSQAIQRPTSKRGT